MKKEPRQVKPKASAKKSRPRRVRPIVDKRRGIITLPSGKTKALWKEEEPPE